MLVLLPFPTPCWVCPAWPADGPARPGTARGASRARRTGYRTSRTPACGSGRTAQAPRPPGKGITHVYYKIESRGVGRNPKRCERN